MKTGAHCSLREHWAGAPGVSVPVETKLLLREHWAGCPGVSVPVETKLLLREHWAGWGECAGGD